MTELLAFAFALGFLTQHSARVLLPIFSPGGSNQLLHFFFFMLLHHTAAPNQKDLYRIA
jgi:hypothetical protein